MDIAPIVVHGWRFELTGAELVISSEQNPQAQLRLSARAAYSLLDYLYQYRDNLHNAARQEEDTQVEVQKSEMRTNNDLDQATVE